MVTKKITRKEIKQPDEFITLWSRVFEFAVQHKKEAFWILGGLLALAILISAWTVYSQTREQKAMALLGEAQELLGSALTEQNKEGAAKDPEKATELLRRLAEEYGGSHAAQMGRVLLGNVYYHQGEVARAIETFREFLDRGYDVPELKGLVWEGLAYCYEALGRYEEAAEHYRNASDVTPSYSPGWALLGLARCHEKLGNFGQAAEDYRKLLADHPQHPKAGEASAGIARITQLDAGKDPGSQPQDSDSGVKNSPADAAGPVP